MVDELAEERTESFVEQRLAHTTNRVLLRSNAHVDLPFHKAR
jgi:hypothetical protein